MNNEPTLTTEPHEPLITRHRDRPSLIWLVPAIAVLIGLSMLVQTWLSAGSTITITFPTAEGMTAGKTVIKYKDVTVGTVTAIDLANDGSHVIATVSLVKSAFSLTSKDTRFWIVRPRIGVHGVSGIDTLLSGTYIAVDRGKSNVTSTSFVGLEDPPAIISSMPGKSFMLHAQDLGSLDIGSPVYYRQIQVGRVVSYKLGQKGENVDIQVFVDEPHDYLVTTSSRFWQASGVDLSIGADGVKVTTQSLASILVGGIAFDSPKSDQGLPAPEQSEFQLADDQETALAPPNGPPLYAQLRFDQPLHGLSAEADVTFFGMSLGHVVSIGLDYDPANELFSSVVDIVVFPLRLERALNKLSPTGDDQKQSATQQAQSIQRLVEHGLRAQAKSGNLLTGQQYIALEFIPDAPKVDFDADARPLMLPTVSGSSDQIEEHVASILAKINKLPFESIGEKLDASLSSFDTALGKVSSLVLPEAAKTLKQTQGTLVDLRDLLSADAPLQQDLTQTIVEIKRASRSFRTLIDILSRHPEALLRGLH